MFPRWSLLIILNAVVFITAFKLLGDQMIRYYQNAEAAVPVTLEDTSGSAITSVAYTSVTATVLKADLTNGSATPSGSTKWIDLSSAVGGDFASKGEYILKIAASLTDVPGMLLYFVNAGAAKVYRGMIEIVTYKEADIYPVVDRTRKLTEGRWKLIRTGAGANTMNIYAPDGTTILQTYNVLNDLGNPDADKPYERVPTISFP